MLKIHMYNVWSHIYDQTGGVMVRVPFGSPLPMLFYMENAYRLSMRSRRIALILYCIILYQIERSYLLWFTLAITANEESKNKNT